jgi:hypothetical protein
MKSGWFILAESDVLERLGEQFQDREVSWETWLGLALPILLIGVLYGFFRWWMGPGGKKYRSGPWALFRELAAAHRLTWGEKRVLRRFARTARLSHPAHVFLDATVYDNRSAAQQLPKTWPRIQAVRQKLFAS